MWHNSFFFLTGFLNVGHPEIHGNQALSDIRAALTWVKDNIAFFGGDPERVTVFGHGHGAALVNILLLMPNIGEGKLLDSVYFHYVIFSTALTKWTSK